jgi:Protein of unknown function (DUF3263)
VPQPSHPARHQASHPATEGRLDDRGRALLAFEREWWRYGEAKETAIRERFALSSEAYYRALNALIDLDDALAHDPMLVRRLRRMRSRRHRERSARRLGQRT